MSQSPYFSIIIPTYNRADFILQTLETVFQQTFTNYEVIVIDNASTDNTAEILRPLIDQQKIKYIRHDRNYERAKSRNTGHKAATGLFATYLDSDDFMYPTNLADAHAFSLANPGFKVFHNLYELVDYDRNVIYHYPFNDISNPVKQICKGNFLSCIGVFLHQDIYKKLDWDEAPLLTGSEDYEFWIRVIGSEKKVGRIHKFNSGILHHANRTMNHIQVKTTDDRFRYIIDKIEKSDKLFPVYKPYMNRLKGFRWLFLASISSKTGSLTTIKFLLKGLRYDTNILFSRAFYYSLLQLTKHIFKNNQQ